MKKNQLYVLPPLILQIIAWPVAHFVLGGIGKLRIIKPKELEKTNGPFIFASNHYSELDPILQRAMLSIFSKHSPLFWVARKKHHYDWKGWRGVIYSDAFFEAWGAYPSYSGHKDYKKSLEHHINIIKDGHSMGIFPQGEKEKHLHWEEIDTRGGVVFLSAETKAPVVPVYIDGARGISAKELFFGKSNITVVVGEPIHLNHPEDPKHYKENAHIIMKEIHKLKSRI